jgi:hypothetical protein
VEEATESDQNGVVVPMPRRPLWLKTDEPAKYALFDTEKLVVLAPPFALKSPAVMVDEAFEMKPLVKVARPVEVKVPPSERVPMVPFCANKFVDDAVVAKKADVVALRPVKFWRVVEERRRRFVAVREPIVPDCAKRFVDEAVVEKKFVDVALVKMLAPRVETPEMLRAEAETPPVKVAVAFAPKVTAPLVPLMARAATVEVAPVVEVAR